MRPVCVRIAQLPEPFLRLIEDDFGSRQKFVMHRSEEPGQDGRRIASQQQQISGLESPAYEGHSLSMLRRVAAALHARVSVVLEPLPEPQKSLVAHDKSPTYRVKKSGPNKGKDNRPPSASFRLSPAAPRPNLSL